MLVNGTAKDPDNQPIYVDEGEIIDVYEQVLQEHNKKGERSDTIICWALTALSKLTIRLKGVDDRVKGLIEQFTDHMNVEIQQRACEFMQIFERQWDGQREGIFDAIPFKDEENWTVDVKGRAALDEDEGDAQLLINPGAAAQSKKKDNQIVKEE